MEEKQLASGGFAWFDGGEENIFITQHILSGFGHYAGLIEIDSNVLALHSDGVGTKVIIRR